MKKHSKIAKLFAMILAVGVLVSGCGQATDTSSEDQSGASASTSSETENSVASGTDEGETSETAVGDYPVYFHLP